MRIPGLIAVVLAGIIQVGCSDLLENEFNGESPVFTIYQDENASRAYEPLDIVPVADLGYLILSQESSEQGAFKKIQLLRVDSVGKELARRSLPEPYVASIPEIVHFGNSYNIACMDEVGLGTYLLSIDPASLVTSEVFYDPDLSYPLAGSATADGGMILQNYDRDNRRTVITKINTEGQITWSRNVAQVLSDAEPAIVNHLIGSSEENIPFFVKEVPGENRYLLNGFQAFSLSLIMIAVQNGAAEVLGTINGFQDKEGISNLLPLGNDRFATSFYSFEENFFNPTLDLDQMTNQAYVGFWSDLDFQLRREWEPHTRVILKQLTLNDQDIILSAVTTRGGRIMYRSYDPASGNPIGQIYIGTGQRYKLGSIVKGTKGHLVAVNTIYLADRYPRVCFSRFSREESEVFSDGL